MTQMMNLLAQAPTGGGGGNLMLIPMVLLFGIFYMMVIRPQQRKEKERLAMIGEAKKGNRVIFGGGIFGVITNVKDNKFTVKIADNVKIDILKSAVTQVLEKGDQAVDEEPTKK